MFVKTLVSIAPIYIIKLIMYGENLTQSKIKNLDERKKD
jgi:hypothetical protein